MTNLTWRISYAERAHAQEELISDHIRAAYLVLVAGWVALIIFLFLCEFLGDTPDPIVFLREAIVASIAVAAFYGALVGIRTFAHRKPNHWHALNWGVIWLFLIGVITYYLSTEGLSQMTLVAFLTLVCVYTYRWLMHHATYSFEITDKGVSEHVTFFGHKQTYHTAWSEVNGHRVHSMTGSVELHLKGHHWHVRPRCHLIVPTKRVRKEAHDVLAQILWKKKKRQ